MDFVVDSHGEILHIEVKSGKNNRKLTALDNIMKIENYEIEEAFILPNENVDRKEKLIYFPIYMIMFLNEDYLVLPKVEISDF